MSDTYHFYVITDLHISSKTGRVARAFEKCKDGQFLLMTGDLVNDGKETQFTKLKNIIDKHIPILPVFSVSGNHDYPLNPLPQMRTETCDYPGFQSYLQRRAESFGITWK